jgi:peptide/nickel transport system permease protein
VSVTFILRRLLQSLLTIFVVLVLVFFTTHMLGDPVSIMLPQGANQAQVDALRQQLHLNEPLLTQFWSFILHAFSGSFGNSYWQSRPALPIVLEHLPATLYLGAVAFLMIVPIGIGLGTAAALGAGSVLDRIISMASFVSISMVDFWLALMLILIFAVRLRLLPTSGYGGFTHVLLPAVTLTVLQVGALAQMTRSSIQEQLSKSFVAAARARGLSETRVVFQHVLRNSLIPIVTIIGSIMIALAGGAVIAEVVFGWPGAAQLLIQAVDQRDLPLIEAAIFVGAVSVTIINLIVDVVYQLVNPRVRTQGPGT